MISVRIIVGGDDNAVGELAACQGLLCLLAIDEGIEFHKDLVKWKINTSAINLVSEISKFTKINFIMFKLVNASFCN